ncbi:pentapeptide repeat-containing protein [Campylobacter coli]|uniref:pentapeptide repeat-containing protein n=1 Tax=Campylobacter coli TaxID=195 RepID=UPI001BFF981A|nr:pentapeptide repeat-containing protein [Campylobacter coli]HEF9787477.1 pentapeptide repeat-containing protein [Campylobacter coli]HEF9827028.1 pentapeptide repeat-containing protein [Campylobacter coli]HEF9836454.1 pentapeptide repeat-containing protein [Campylobacter coli]HEF9838306.1 pentapeptide repeat-containing protein [Campylobacter coli]HEF9845472.1 pentapeptide repeat-containing protein [Campylobacter coli]
MEEFDKEQAIADIAEKLNIQKDKISYIEYSDLFQINDCVIPAVIADNIKVFQEYNLYFYRCTIPNLILEITIKSLEFKMCCFESSFIIRNNFDGYISIQDSIFEKDFGIFWVKKEVYKINVCKNIFKDVSIFENKILNFNFEENSIQNISICNNLFTKEAYFNANSFNYECIFFKNSFENLSFYEANFEKSFIFFQNIIKGNLNAINANLNFTFDNLEEKIEQEYQEFNKNKKKEDKKSLDKFANDFRDSFRTFKNALIKDNNLLDASNFHKYELYCKEIELKNKKGKTFKDVVDRWQLFFYCKLCDHHTDILQSLNSLILVIGIFVISSVAMVFGFNYSLGYKPILEHWYFSLDFYNHHINSIIQDNYLFVATVNLVMLFGYLILVGFALCLKYMREFFIIISYVITLLVLAISPKILIPAMGIFTDKRAMLDPLSVFGGIYTIVFGFVAFSFIKTIRKNSIVPS